MGEKIKLRADSYNLLIMVGKWKYIQGTFMKEFKQT